MFTACSATLKWLKNRLQCRLKQYLLSSCVIIRKDGFKSKLNCHNFLLLFTVSTNPKLWCGWEDIYSFGGAITKRLCIFKHLTNLHFVGVVTYFSVFCNPSHPCQKQTASRFMFPSASVGLSAARGGLTRWEPANIVGFTNSSLLDAERDEGRMCELWIICLFWTNLKLEAVSNNNLFYFTLFEKFKCPVIRVTVGAGTVISKRNTELIKLNKRRRFPERN